MCKCYLTLPSKDGNFENLKTTHQKFSVNKVKLSAPAFINLVDWVKGLSRLNIMLLLAHADDGDTGTVMVSRLELLCLCWNGAGWV